MRRPEGEDEGGSGSEEEIYRPEIEIPGMGDDGDE